MFVITMHKTGDEDAVFSISGTLFAHLVIKTSNRSTVTSIYHRSSVTQLVKRRTNIEWDTRHAGPIFAPAVLI